MSEKLTTVDIRVLTREDLVFLKDKTESDIISSRQWIVEDNKTFFLCYCSKEAALDCQEPRRLLCLGLEKLKAELGEIEWKKPYAVITRDPNAIGTVGSGDAHHVVLPIMWQTTLDNAENLWYFIHEITEYHLITRMGDLPRWFWEGMAQIVAYLIVKEIDPHGAASVQQTILNCGTASLEDYLQWDKVWTPADTGQHLDADATIAAVLAAVDQVHFAPKEKHKYAKALEFFCSRITCLSEARTLLTWVQKLSTRTTEQLLAVMEL